MTSAKLPPFVREYAVEGGCIYIHSNTPVGSLIVENFVKSKVGEEKYLESEYASFWILEGLVYEVELPEEQYPTVNYYLAERSGKDLEARWQLYCKHVDALENFIFVRCFTETRRHLLETLADKTDEEKKTSLSQESSNTEETKPS
jgi:hypothetical protein